MSTEDPISGILRFSWTVILQPHFFCSNYLIPAVFLVRQDEPRTFYICLILPMSKLFEQLGGQDDSSRNIPLECYEFLSAKTPEEQEQLFKILLEMDKYRSK